MCTACTATTGQAPPVAVVSRMVFCMMVGDSVIVVEEALAPATSCRS